MQYKTHIAYSLQVGEESATLGISIRGVVLWRMQARNKMSWTKSLYLVSYLNVGGNVNIFRAVGHEMGGENRLPLGSDVNIISTVIYFFKSIRRHQNEPGGQALESR